MYFCAITTLFPTFNNFKIDKYSVNIVIMKTHNHITELKKMYAQVLIELQEYSYYMNCPKFKIKFEFINIFTYKQSEIEKILDFTCFCIYLVQQIFMICEKKKKKGRDKNTPLALNFLKKIAGDPNTRKIVVMRPKHGFF